MYNDEHNLYHYTYRKDGSEAEAHSAPHPTCHHYWYKSRMG